MASALSQIRSLVLRLENQHQPGHHSCLTNSIAHDDITIDTAVRKPIAYYLRSMCKSARECAIFVLILGRDATYFEGTKSDDFTLYLL